MLKWIIRSIGVLVVIASSGCSCNMKSFYKPMNLDVAYNDVGVIEIGSNIDLIFSYSEINRHNRNDSTMQIHAMLEVGPESTVLLEKSEIEVSSLEGDETRSIQLEAVEYTISCPPGSKDWSACFSSNELPVKCKLSEVPTRYPVFHRYSFSPTCEFVGAVDKEPEGIRYRLVSRDYRRYILVTKPFKMNKSEQLIVKFPSIVVNRKVHHVLPVKLNWVSENVCRPIPLQ